MNTKFDAPIAAAKTHKILFENDKVRILEVHIPAGVKEPLHEHPYKSITIIESPARLKYCDKDGKEISTVLNEGVSWIEPMGLHTAENVDSRPFKGYRVELKK